MATIYPKAVWQPVANHSGPLSAHLGLVVHVQVGDGSCYGEFNNPGSQASSTWQAMKDGTILQFVDADVCAWTEMAGNPYYDSVETEGTPDEPLTDAQCQALAELIAWGHQTFGWPLALVDHGGTGVTTHAHYPSGDPDPDWGGHPCPGPTRAMQLPGILATAQQIATGNPPAAPQEDDMPNPSGKLAAPIVAVCERPNHPGSGWRFGADGGVFPYGDAPLYDTSAVTKVKLASPIVGAAVAENGYTLIGSDGGSFPFGPQPPAVPSLA